MLFMNLPAMMLAQEATTHNVGGVNSAAIGWATMACGVIVLGSAAGIAYIAGKALDALARQPEIGGRAFSTMVIAAALVEGVTFFALLVCFLALYWLH